jgi:hypothetical protein
MCPYRIMFDRTIRADPVRTKRIMFHQPNCEHHKASGPYIETSVKSGQNR